jgi:hypothetical protein
VAWNTLLRTAPYKGEIVNDEELRRKTEELETELYGEDSPVSEEEIGWLLNGLRHHRGMLARYLVKTSELTGFSPTKLIEMLEIDLRSPEYWEHMVNELYFVCEDLHRKGYGPRIQQVLTTDGMFGREGEDPFPSVISMINSFELIRMRNFVFDLPKVP